MSNSGVPNKDSIRESPTTYTKDSTPPDIGMGDRSGNSLTNAATGGSTNVMAYVQDLENKVKGYRTHMHAWVEREVGYQVGRGRVYAFGFGAGAVGLIWWGVSLWKG